jgi:hypothetical protein
MAANSRRQTAECECTNSRVSIPRRVAKFLIGAALLNNDSSGFGGIGMALRRRLPQQVGVSADRLGDVPAT